MKKICFCIATLAVALTGRAAVITTVGSVSDMQALSSSVNTSGDSYAGVTVTLTADLDFSEAGSWEPIGTDAHPFTGTFDGQGHTISNLSADGSASLAAGLFGIVGGGGVVKDVNIGSGIIAISRDPGDLSCYLGSIVGLNEGTVVGCSSSATVSGYGYEHARIGGIAGTNNGIIQNCYFLGTVYTGLPNVFIGGIVGYNKEKGVGTVQNCFTRCRVVTNASEEASYPLCGNNNGGTVMGCFYANGREEDTTPVSFAIVNKSVNSTTISGNAGSGKNVLLSSRTLFTDGDWNTLCLPFDIAASGNGRSPIAGAKVKTLSATSYSSNTLTLTFENVGAIEAGKPYIVRWEKPFAGDLSNPLFLDVTVSGGTTDITTSFADFIGTYDAVVYDAGAAHVDKLFLGANNGLYYPDGLEPTSINACRAYFALKGVDANDLSQASARAFVLDFGDDEPTAVEEIQDSGFKIQDSRFNVQCSMDEDVWYDLNGRKYIERPTKPGIYVHNGRKETVE